MFKIKREIGSHSIKEDSVLALEIEVQGLKEELFRERDLRRKEQFDDSVADGLRRKLIDMEH